jgi:hypothetical protein
MVITGISTMTLFIAMVSNGVRNVSKVSAHHQPASLCGCMLDGHRHGVYGAVYTHNKRGKVLALISLVCSQLYCITHWPFCSFIRQFTYSMEQRPR